MVNTPGFGNDWHFKVKAIFIGRTFAFLHMSSLWLKNVQQIEFINKTKIVGVGN